MFRKNTKHQQPALITAAGLTTQYELDNGRVLSANAARNVTTFLYGLGPIGELTTDWACSLPDGTGAPQPTQKPVETPQKPPTPTKGEDPGAGKQSQPGGN